jgi:PleD family two-component response regulator
VTTVTELFTAASYFDNATVRFGILPTPAFDMAKILVADDSRFQLALLSSALRQKGFEVVIAEDGLQAGMLACVPRRTPWCLT